MELALGVLGLLRVEAGDLHQDAVTPLRGDDRLADSVLIHALADDFHGLLQQVWGDAIFCRRHQSDQERSAALQIQSQADFFVWRNDLLDAKRGEQHRQHQAEPAFPRREVAGKIPAEEDKQKQAESKSQRG